MPVVELEGLVGGCGVREGGSETSYSKAPLIYEVYNYQDPMFLDEGSLQQVFSKVVGETPAVITDNFPLPSGASLTFDLFGQTKFVICAQIAFSFTEY
ncbi:hypothetical protein CVT25_011556 [Psilocybe cyanescens]|uniref:Uncharacterized protein n=1 Tax=Psilocybe cyanescens TaxID=93625 RepID=A0A409VVB7_PSICY|nr:hypothetical protein CVT25_011556 [Psilocybe cyanescens]